MRFWTSPRCWATSNPNRLITPHTESGVALLFPRYRHTRFLMFVLPPTCAKVVDTTEGPAFRRAPPVALSIPYGLAELPPRGHVTQVRASHCHGLRCAAVQRNLGERGGEANDLLGLDLGRHRQSVGVGNDLDQGGAAVSQGVAQRTFQVFSLLNTLSLETSGGCDVGVVDERHIHAEVLEALNQLLKLHHAQGGVVEHHDGQRQIVHDRCQNITQHHGQATVTRDRDDLAVRLGNLGAQGHRHGVRHGAVEEGTQQTALAVGVM